MRAVERLLVDVSNAWQLDARPTLKFIGCSALLLRTNYDRGTKDGDVLQTAALDSKSREHPLALAGKGTALAYRSRVYIEIVGSGVPFLPQSPKWHPVAIAGMSDTLAVEALDVVDVVVSKLKRFHGDDRADVEAMISRKLVPHELLIERFRSAVDVWADGAAADDLPRYVRNLHQVERDMFVVDETEIELPSWVE
jgi:hypothetical protein